MEGPQMGVANGRGGDAIRRCPAGDALRKNNCRTRRRRCRSGWPEAEVVHLGGETLRGASGRLGVAIDDLGTRVVRRSRVERSSAAVSRAVAARAENVELGNR